MVADHLIARIRGDRAPPGYDGTGTCYIEFGGDEVGRVDVDFFSTPGHPTGTFVAPSDGDGRGEGGLRVQPARSLVRGIGAPSAPCSRPHGPKLMASRVRVDVEVVPERHIDPPEEGFDPARPFAWGPEALLVLRGFLVVDASDRASELIARDLTGSDIRTAIPGWPEDPDTSEPFDAVLRVHDEDLPIEVRARSLPDGLVVASIRDARALIAGRKAQALLVEAEQKYRSLVEQIPAVVYSDDGAVHELRQPADRGDPRREARRVPRRSRHVDADGPPRRPRDGRGGERRVPRRPRRRPHRLPDGAAGRPHRVDPRPGVSPSGTRRAGSSGSKASCSTSPS